MTPRRRRRWLFALGVLIVYIVVMVCGCGRLADRLMLFPTTDAIPNDGDRRIVHVNEQPVEVWTAYVGRSARPKMFLLEYTGNATRAEDMIDFLAHRYAPYDAEVWVMNYPGYGGSAGPASLRSIAPAALGVYDELVRHAVGRPVLVSGNSIGTAAALHVSANRPVAGVLLQNPPPLRQMILRRYGWWNLWLLAGPIALQVPADLDSIANARRCTAPAAFALAERDEIVPPKYQQMVVEAYAGPKQLIPLKGAFHNSPNNESSEQQWQSAVRQLIESIEPQESR